MEICQKIFTVHAQTFKVTGIDIKQSTTYNFLLLFYSNY